MRYFVLSSGIILFIVDRLVKDVFALRSIVCNTGIAFGIALPEILLMIALSIAFISLVVFLVRAYRAKDIVLCAALLFMFGGALSNGMDRVMYGCVVDYLFISRSFVWFNIADMSIFGGGLMLLWRYYKQV